jgi:hypothetical protein
MLSGVKNPFFRNLLELIFEGRKADEAHEQEQHPQTDGRGEGP